MSTINILANFSLPKIKLKFIAFFIMCKPRVNLLIVFTAVIGMLLASNTLPSLRLLFFASLGIAFLAFSAAAVNCVIEQSIDSKMARTRERPLPKGEVGSVETLICAGILLTIGLAILYWEINTLTMWLTLATFFGYAIIYTAILKPATPMNIVIGGASGAMPPVLGWCAVTGDIGMGAMILFLIIFLWTPPHFWALACYRRDEYAKAGLPMLPITHGLKYTTLQILLYTILLFGICLLPFVLHMSNLLYLLGAILMNSYFLYFAISLHKNYSDELAKKTFRVSLIYLPVIFSLLFIDRLF